MQVSVLTLIRHCAGSSASAHCSCLTAGTEAVLAGVQGYLDMRALAQKDGGEMESVTGVTENRGRGCGRELRWHGKVTSEKDLKGREGVGGVKRMHKKGQMVPLGAQCLTGFFFTEAALGWVQISIVTTPLSQFRLILLRHS